MLTAAHTTCPDRTVPATPAVRQRALELLTTEIHFINSGDFRSERTGLDEARVEASLRQPADGVNAPATLPSHLRQLCEAQLLTRDEEIALFREMNFAKYRANALRSRIDPDQVDSELVAEVDRHLARAKLLRDRILQANMRLVMSIVKKFVTPQISFDELLSDGIIVLMQAVEMFDYTRGFRFSTYAYRSIARNAYRNGMAARRHESRLTRDADGWAFEQTDDDRSSAYADQVWSNVRELVSSLLDRLDRREQLIIRSRYALGLHRRVRTFQDLADRLGVSKERVRQLEQRAVEKLRTMAGEFPVDDLFGAAMV